MAHETLSSLSFGTPLKPIDEDDREAQIRPKPIAVHEQIVTDENGRRRFHGAFSGGFSAGYFNSVGSRDGWTPKHFKSSRSSKRESDDGSSEKNKFQQKAQDFMDDEDIADFGIAPKKLQATSNFFQKNDSKRAKPSHNSDDYFDKKNARLSQISDIFKGSNENSTIPCGQPVFEQIFVSVKETIGVRLLREMGWKPGQGIGPRVTRKRKKDLTRKNQKLFQKGETSTVASLSDDDDSSEKFISKYQQFLFAPDDVPAVLSQKAKENLFGIAYRGLDRTQSSSEHFSLFTPESSMPSKDKGTGKSKINNRFPQTKAIIGQAFGVGVYEEEDEDIYAKDDASRYDFYIEPSQTNKDIGVKRSSRWEDTQDHQYLQGFVPEKTPSKLNKATRFSPPQLPSNYRPNPIRKTRFAHNDVKNDLPSCNQQDDVTSRSQSVQKPTIGSLDEKPSNLNDSIKLESDNAKQNVATSSEDLRILVEEIQNQHKASSAVLSSDSSNTFKPYANDPPKQKRYEQYIICLKNGRRDALHLLQPKDMTEWERNREQTEFDRAAVLYHNSDDRLGSRSASTSFMSSRFVSAKSSEELDIGKDLHSSKNKDTLPLSEAEKAADLKCYGKLTREKVEWHPARILCIRFNVKQPYGDSSIIGAPPGYKCRLDIFKNVSENDSEPKKSAQHSTRLESDKKLEKYLTSSTSEEEKSKTVNEVETENFKKASNDLFKAIFLDSDESCDSDNDNAKETDQNSIADSISVPSSTNDLVKIDDNATKQSNDDVDLLNEIHSRSNQQPKNYKQPKGLFANIDFSSFNKKRNNTNTSAEKEKSVIGPSRKRQTATDFLQTAVDTSDKSSNDESETFGPKKPRQSIDQSDSKVHEKLNESIDESDEWMEDNPKISKETFSKEKKKKAKIDKHKKSKKKRSKHERKHKRKSKSDRKKVKKSRKKHYSSSSSDETTASSE